MCIQYIYIYIYIFIKKRGKKKKKTKKIRELEERGKIRKKRK